MATVPETVVQFLTAHGWQPHSLQPGGERDVRLTLRGKGAALEIDHRPAREELWLWILGPADKRCLGLPYRADLRGVLAKIVELQDELSLAGYLGQYLTLQKVCPVMIMAWEQFAEQDGEGIATGRARGEG